MVTNMRFVREPGTARVPRASVTFQSSRLDLRQLKKSEKVVRTMDILGWSDALERPSARWREAELRRLLSSVPNRALRDIADLILEDILSLTWKFTPRQRPPAKEGVIDLLKAAALSTPTTPLAEDALRLKVAVAKYRPWREDQRHAVAQPQSPLPELTLPDLFGSKDILKALDVQGGGNWRQFRDRFRSDPGCPIQWPRAPGGKPRANRGQLLDWKRNHLGSKEMEDLKAEAFGRDREVQRPRPYKNGLVISDGDIDVSLNVRSHPGKDVKPGTKKAGK